MAGCLLDIGKTIITDCLLPPIKIHFDYWWCFHDNIEDLIDGVRDLDRETSDINQKIEEARLRTEKLRPGVEDWANSGFQKLAEARRILQDGNIPRSWNLISRYSMGKTAKKTAEEIAKLRNDGNFNSISDPAPPPSMGCTSHRSTMDFDSRKRIEDEIIESLRRSTVGLIGICGMGGVGKTTMAKRIRNRVMEEKLVDEVVMVVVSQQIDMPKIQKEVAELLGLKFDVDSMSARAHKLRERLTDAKRKIVIFDDVWDSLNFEELGIPFESDFERCKVLFTSRSTDTCKEIKNKEVFDLKILEEAEAWILFKEKAGECVEDSALLPVAKDVVAECKGLPIALVTVATALQDRSKYAWEDSLSQLKLSNPKYFPKFLEGVYNPLKLSYDYLDNKCEQLLLLLCCLFPEDCDIPVELLTLYSMGLRLFDDITSLVEARNRTHGLVEKLKSRFLLIDGEEKLHVKMHDVVRDVAIYIGSKENNVFLKSMNKTSIESSSDVKCSWMSVDISKEPIEIPVALRFPKLHLLMLLKLSNEKFSDISFEGMKDLNVLMFAGTMIESLPTTLGLLQNLRILCLFDCDVENISVIGELTSLEVFSCNGCDNIIELPVEIGRLNCLRLLELNECRELQRIPFGILSSLVHLEELKMLGSFDGWEAEENGKEMKNASLTELECLPKLTCLEIGISDSNLAAQEICLSTKLVKYKIYIGYKYYTFEVRDYEKIMKLNLPSDIGAVGNWIQLLVRNSEYLRLEGDGSNNINIEECQDLRELKFSDCSRETLILCTFYNLEEIFDGTILQNQKVSLCNLKSIDIFFCSNLRTLFSVSMARSSLLQLEVLLIVACYAMERVFWNEITDDTDACIEFPRLKKLKLVNLPNLTAFCQGVQTIKFPELTKMEIEDLPKLNSVCPLNDETTSFHFLCNPKVQISGLKSLSLTRLGNNISNIWCKQIPINFFNNLEELKIWRLNGIRSLMSTSVGKKLVSLKYLRIWNCEEMVEVIEGNDDDDKEVLVDIKCLFPTLKRLQIENLPKLRRFWQWNHALELPLLEEVHIYLCSLIETFTMACLNTPNLTRLWINSRRIDDMKDLNDIIISRLSQNTSMIEEDKDEDENDNEDKDKDDNKIKYNNEKEEDEGQEKVIEERFNVKND